MRAASVVFPLCLVGLAATFAASCASDKARAGSPVTPGGTHPTVIPGCEDTDAAGQGSLTEGPDASVTPAPPVVKITDDKTLFATRIEPGLELCRTCHQQGGVADTDAGRTLLLANDGTSAQDHDDLLAAWTALGKETDQNPLLVKGANLDPAGHSGGALWPEDGPLYEDVKTLFACWADPGKCATLLSRFGGGVPKSETLPLLGDLTATGGRNYAAVYCEKKPDCATLPQDPRELIAGENLNNPNYAVYFNDPFEICQTDALFANQAAQNKVLTDQGKEPVYTAKPRPKTCGEWRTAVEHGREYIVSNPITGAVFTVQSLINLSTHLGNALPTDIAGANTALALISQTRYGWPESPYRNPAPYPGEDPNEKDGGSLQLPLSLAQVKDDAGKWTGKIGVTCFGCHVGQIGTGEVIGNTASTDGHPEIYGGSKNGVFLGLNGSNTDAALALFDTTEANGLTGPDAFDAVLANPAYLAGRTRGTNAADQEIVSVLTGRNFDTLDWIDPSYAPERDGKNKPPILPISASGGDQDMPTWWWTHNKTRYLWVGFGSSGSSRGNFFPASTNPNDGHWSKHREGDFQDMDMWLNTVEAPKFVGPDIDMHLAEQGAILFHGKDLWADPGNQDIPRPGGNGTCAGCHGAYSPLFIHQNGYLPDPRLAGTVGYTVPLNVLGTDPSQSSLYSLFPASGRTAVSGINDLWMSYPDAQDGYVIPESRAAGAKANTNTGDMPDRKCGLGALGGYTAQPLHGVWASGPYFHNGSVPTVWDVLKPSDRPNVWRRQQVPASEAGPDGSRGYDTVLTRAYDYEKLGWKYAPLECDAADGASYNMSCLPGHDVDVPPGVHAVDDRTIYDTNAFSKGNHGHEYTKVLTDLERRALIEYLKTL